MYAKKLNRVIQVNEQTKDFYINQGYDICDDKGKVIEHGKGATVSAVAYQKLAEENEKLAEENEKLKEQIEKLKTKK